MMRIKGDISSMDTAKEMRTELVEMDQFSITITPSAFARTGPVAQEK